MTRKASGWKALGRRHYLKARRESGTTTMGGKCMGQRRLHESMDGREGVEFNWRQQRGGRAAGGLWAMVRRARGWKALGDGAVRRRGGRAAEASDQGGKLRRGSGEGGKRNNDDGGRVCGTMTSAWASAWDDDRGVADDYVQEGVGKARLEGEQLVMARSTSSFARRRGGRVVEASVHFFP